MDPPSKEVGKYSLSISLKNYVALFWESDFVGRLNTDKLQEVDVTLTPWEEASSNRSGVTLLFKRLMKSAHPLPVQLPWLPLFVQTIVLVYNFLFVQSVQ